MYLKAFEGRSMPDEETITLDLLESFLQRLEQPWKDMQNQLIDLGQHPIPKYILQFE